MADFRGMKSYEHSRSVESQNSLPLYEAGMAFTAYRAIAAGPALQDSYSQLLS